jgi:hypothetical protein
MAGRGRCHLIEQEPLFPMNWPVHLRNQQVGAEGYVSNWIRVRPLDLTSATTRLLECVKDGDLS